MDNGNGRELDDIAKQVDRMIDSESINSEELNFQMRYEITTIPESENHEEAIGDENNAEESVQHPPPLVEGTLDAAEGGSMIQLLDDVKRSDSKRRSTKVQMHASPSGLTETGKFNVIVQTRDSQCVSSSSSSTSSSSAAPFTKPAQWSPSSVPHVRFSTETSTQGSAPSLSRTSPSRTSISKLISKFVTSMSSSKMPGVITELASNANNEMQMVHKQPSIRRQNAAAAPPLDFDQELGDGGGSTKQLLEDSPQCSSSQPPTRPPRRPKSDEIVPHGSSTEPRNTSPQPSTSAAAFASTSTSTRISRPTPPKVNFDEIIQYHDFDTELGDGGCSSASSSRRLLGRGKRRSPKSKASESPSGLTTTGRFNIIVKTHDETNSFSSSSSSATTSSTPQRKHRQKWGPTHQVHYHDVPVDVPQDDNNERLATPSPTIIQSQAVQSPLSRFFHKVFNFKNRNAPPAVPALKPIPVRSTMAPQLVKYFRGFYAFMNLAVQCEIFTDTYNFFNHNLYPANYYFPLRRFYYQPTPIKTNHGKIGAFSLDEVDEDFYSFNANENGLCPFPYEGIRRYDLNIPFHGNEWISVRQTITYLEQMYKIRLGEYGSTYSLKDLAYYYYNIWLGVDPTDVIDADLLKARSRSNRSSNGGGQSTPATGDADDDYFGLIKWNVHAAMNESRMFNEESITHFMHDHLSGRDLQPFLNKKNFPKYYTFNDANSLFDTMRKWLETPVPPNVDPRSKAVYLKNVVQLTEERPNAYYLPIHQSRYSARTTFFYSFWHVAVIAILCLMTLIVLLVFASYRFTLNLTDYILITCLLLLFLTVVVPYAMWQFRFNCNLYF